MKKLLRYILLAALILSSIAAALFIWVGHELHEAGKTDAWRRDGVPSTVSLRRQGWEDRQHDIYRMVEVGHSSRWNGDGEELIICCYVPEKFQNMRADLQAKWQPGFPASMGWRQYIEREAPKDLVIPASADPDNFVHTLREYQLGWTIIDMTRGISYTNIVRR